MDLGFVCFIDIALHDLDYKLNKLFDHTEE